MGARNLNFATKFSKMKKFSLVIPKYFVILKKTLTREIFFRQVNSFFEERGRW